MVKEGNIIFFDNDDEFYNWCVIPQIIINDNNAADFCLSNEYENAVSNKCKFVIKDEDSSIFKHGAVSYRTITKPIIGLCQYFPGITKY